MTSVREPAVAGSFYPSEPHELSTAIELMLEQVRTRPGRRRVVGYGFWMLLEDETCAAAA